MDGSQASHLPVELWIRIARTLHDEFPCRQPHSIFDGPLCTVKDCPRTDFKAIRPLSESCRFLRAVFQPMLYEYVSVNANNIHAVASLASSLSARQDLRSSVRTLELTNVQAGGNCDALLEVLPLLAEIRFLSLTDGTIEEAIVKLLHNAVRLRILHVMGAEWGTDVPENWLDGGSFGGNLTELFVGNMGENSPYSVPRILQLFVATLKVLYIGPSVILELVGLPAFLSFCPSILRLYTWHSDEDSCPSLFQLLTQTPNLEKLWISGLGPASSTDDEFLPKLRTIYAQDSFVTALLPGRPIRSITTEAKLELFTTPLPRLEVLRLYELPNDDGLKIIDTLLSACPGLIRLELECKRPMLNNWIETRLASDLAALPRLQTFNINFCWHNRYKAESVQYPLSEEMLLERENIAQVKRQYCPDLCDVWLNSKYAWMYVRDEAAWAPQRRVFL